MIDNWEKLYKGFIRTQGKQSKEKIKGRDNFTNYDDIQGVESYAGVLADNTILVDIDNKEDSEIIYNIVKGEDLKCLVYESTRGKHFLFYNNEEVEKNYTGTGLACGIKSDIKLGIKNSYESLQIDKVKRTILRDINSNEDYQQIPIYLLPVSNFKDFAGMENGDGRNQEIFNYILTLQNDGFSNDQIKEILTIINKYVLSEPLSEKEFDTVTRDEAFMKPSFYERKVFQFDKFANYLINNFNIKKIDNQISIYENGIYVADTKYIENKMIELIPTLNRAKRKEVLEYIDISIIENSNPAPARYIAFKNGIYDVVMDEFIDFSPDIIIQNKIPHNYNPKSYDESMEKVLNNISTNDEAIKQNILEMVGYTFYRKNHLRKMFMLVGDKKNGKSTFLDILQHLLGDTNISSLDLSELDERFKTAEIHNKLANIGDDIEEDFIARTSIFKKISTGNRLVAERKGQDPFEFDPYAKMIFSANNPPRIRDRTGAVQSRLLMIPFNATFSENDPDFDPFIGDKVVTENAMEYLINLGLGALKEILINKQFTDSKASRKLEQEYEKTNNPVLEFLEDEKVVNESVDDIFMRYEIFCEENKLGTMAKNTFTRQVNQIKNTEIKRESVNGKQIKYFKEK